MDRIHGIEIGKDGVDGGVPLELPYITGRFSGDLLVLGCGSTMWSDYAQVHHKFQGHRLGVSRTILDFTEPLEHGVSCHPYELLLFTLYRRYAYLEHDNMYSHSCDIYDWESYETHIIPQFVWHFPEYKHGSSTLHGVLAGLIMGYDRIVLAGAPMDRSGYYYNPHWVYDYPAQFMADWERAAKTCFRGKVTSLSGNTRELLGAPEWLLN